MQVAYTYIHKYIHTYIHTYIPTIQFTTYVSGHYAPQLSELIFENNKKASKENYINFKGFMVSTEYIYIILEMKRTYIYICRWADDV
jgi:hypothetical protein